MHTGLNKIHEPSEITAGLLLALSETDRDLDFFLDIATARMIITLGIAVLIAMFA